MMDDTTPMYNLKAVVNEVGLSAATLRAWERRYGLLKPKRSAGGHRLYSRKDIETLKWLVKRQSEGLSISQAVEMWNQMVDSGQTPPVPAHLPVAAAGETMLDELRAQWLAACMAFDDLGANQVLDQAFTIAAPEAICSEVLQKGLARLGEGWYTGTVSVQQEHFASALAMRRINALLAGTNTPTRAGRILVACPPGEEHDFPMLMTAYLLRRWGWEVIYLGANVPLNNLDETIQATAPVLIVSAAQTLVGAAALRGMFEFIVDRKVVLAFGGGIFTHIPAAVHAIPGHYLGAEIAGVPQVVEHLLAEKPAMPAAKPIPAEYARVLTKFEQKQAYLVDYVARIARAKSIDPTHLEQANTNLTRLVASALALGDIHYMDLSVEWLNVLMKNRGLPEELVTKFYGLYSLGVVHFMGRDGTVILDWLKDQIVRLQAAG